MMQSPYAPQFGSWTSQSRSKAAFVATDLAVSNPTLATTIETLTTNAVGNGLTLSMKLDGELLGITKAEARLLGSAIEKRWIAWASNPLEADLSGRFTLHDIAAAAYKTWLRTGEIVAALDWQRCPGASTRTKVNLLDPAQLDGTKTLMGPGGNRTLQGVIFNNKGRAVGYYLLPYTLGNTVQRAPSQAFDAYTPWGRQRIVHIFESLTAGQVRGLSPLAASLTPAHEKNSLQEFTLANALVQTQNAITVESDLPSQSAFAQIAPHDSLTPSLPAASDGRSLSNAMAEAGSYRADYYSKAQIALEAGVVTHLAQGDKLRFHRSETPNSTYDAFDKSLARSAAKAAGSSYEDVSGDYSETSFSASRMASEMPHRINLRRRSMIVERFYRAVFAAWLEEQIETGRIELPNGAPQFHSARDLYTASKWLGYGRVSPDPKKTVEADVLEIQHNLATLSDKLAERGLDLETVIEERKAERELLQAAGLSEDDLVDGDQEPVSQAIDKTRKRK